MFETPFHTTEIKHHSFLVTGGAGFIGSHIVDYLLKYDAGKVIVLDNLSTGFKRNIEHHFTNPNFVFIQGDICDYDTCLEACKNVDYVLHQAALGSVPRSIKFPLETHKANVTGFINMLEAAKVSCVKRFVYASSSSVYGDNIDLPKTELKIGKQLSPYAVSKRADELYAGVFADLFDMEIVGLRYFNIYGPRQNPDGPYAAAIPQFIIAVFSEKSPVIYGNGEQTRDFTFVENAVQANIKALFVIQPLALNNIFNIAVGESVSVNHLFNLIQQNTQTQIIANFADLRAGEIKHSYANITRAKELLQYCPSVKINEGIAATVAWFKNQK